MPLPLEVTQHHVFDPATSGLERLARRPRALPIAIVEPDPAWPAQFAALAARIRGALGERALSVEHVGSTSVPGLPAKAIIDVDVTVADPGDEAAYVPDLEGRAGLLFLLREPGWHNHRLFCLDEPPVCANVHVFGPGSPESVRHKLFRDWLRAHEDDRELYANAKREAAAASSAAGESMQQYTDRKDVVIKEIYERIFAAHE